MKKLEPFSAILLTLLILADATVWYTIAAQRETEYRFDFLDVGQGDSQLLTLKNVQIITDAGPDERVVESLAQALPANNHYLDLAIITHPDLDHYGGFSAILDHYQVGAVLWNGYQRPTGTAPAWEALQAKINAKHIPFIVIGKGDAIRYGSSISHILSPNPLLLASSATNDGGIVQRIETPDFTALLTADIDASVEEYLAAEYEPNVLRADILKVAHHGSRYSSELDFLAAVTPQLAMIQVGKGNSYGHPSPETLERLASSTVQTIFRTDRDGTITLTRQESIWNIRTHPP